MSANWPFPSTELLPGLKTSSVRGQSSESFDQSIHTHTNSTPELGASSSQSSVIHTLEPRVPIHPAQLATTSPSISFSPLDTRGGVGAVIPTSRSQAFDFRDGDAHTLTASVSALPTLELNSPRRPWGFGSLDSKTLEPGVGPWPQSRGSFGHDQHPTGSVTSLQHIDDYNKPALFDIVGTNILLAEDNLINQMVAKKMLTSLGANVTVAADGRAAVEKMSDMQRQVDGSTQFDLVLMDMAMPHMDGIQATEAIRKLGCMCPIVAMTANVTERDQDRCKTAGMDGFLSKPILKERLTSAIHNVKTNRTWFHDAAM